MSLVTIKTDQYISTIDLRDVEKKSFTKQIELFNKTDEILLNNNKNKYNNAKEIINYITSIRAPQQISKSKITLLALMDFFQKKYVSKTFKVNLKKIPNNIRESLAWSEINIISKINNFPHLIGVSSSRNNVGEIISRKQPREFLDGIFYQWILLDYHENFILDFEKLEVFPWIHQTLSNPTYILLDNAIKKIGTKFHADIIFIRRILHSDKYAFHLVGLKNEKNNNFAFKSQFAIKIYRQYRLKKMFNLEKAVYNFYRDKDESAPISSGLAGVNLSKDKPTSLT